MDHPQTQTFEDYVADVLTELRLMSDLTSKIGGSSSSPSSEKDAIPQIPQGKAKLGDLLDDEDLGDPAVAAAMQSGNRDKVVALLKSKRGKQGDLMAKKAAALKTLSTLSL